jgi:hypothetical protein
VKQPVIAERRLAILDDASRFIPHGLAGQMRRRLVKAILHHGRSLLRFQVKARLQFLVDHHGTGLRTGEVGAGKSTNRQRLPGNGSIETDAAPGPCPRFNVLSPRHFR